jgi:hypothetical protein
LVCSVQDDGKAAVGEGNYFPFGLIDLGAMHNKFIKLSNHNNNNGIMINVKSSTYQISDL